MKIVLLVIRYLLIYEDLKKKNQLPAFLRDYGTKISQCFNFECKVAIFYYFMMLLDMRFMFFLIILKEEAVMAVIIGNWIYIYLNNYCLPPLKLLV
jgi:hypothetical protein